MVLPPSGKQILLVLQERFLKIVKKLSPSPVLLETFQGHWCADTQQLPSAPSASLSQGYTGTQNFPTAPDPQVWKSNSANHLHPPPGFPWLPWELSLWGQQETQSLKYREFVFSLWAGAALPYLRGSLWVIKFWLFPTRKSCKSRKNYSLDSSFLWVYENQTL